MLHALIAKLTLPRIFLDANLSESTFNRMLRPVYRVASPHVILPSFFPPTHFGKFDLYDRTLK